MARPDVEIGLKRVNAIDGQNRAQDVNFGSTNNDYDVPKCAELYPQGRMNLDDWASRRISLRAVNDGYAALKDDSLARVVTANQRTGRNAMTTIMERDTIKTITAHYVDGAFVESHGREVMDLISPTNGKTIARVTLGDEEDARAASPPSERSLVSADQRRKRARMCSTL